MCVQAARDKATDLGKARGSAAQVCCIHVSLSVGVHLYAFPSQVDAVSLDDHSRQRMAGLAEPINGNNPRPSKARFFSFSAHPSLASVPDTDTDSRPIAQLSSGVLSVASRPAREPKGSPTRKGVFPPPAIGRKESPTKSLAHSASDPALDRSKRKERDTGSNARSILPKNEHDCPLEHRLVRVPLHKAITNDISSHGRTASPVR